ncbi:MAG: sulfotransferase [Verrucomicrobiota bacterium]
MKEYSSSKNNILSAINVRFEVLWIYLQYMVRGSLIKASVESKLIEPPILIGGCGRSGTTLLLSILSASSDVFAIPVETGIFCKTDPRFLYINWRYNLSFFYGRYFNNIPDTASRWCEKTPMNVLFFDDIMEKFEDQVRLIHIIRDGRDVVLSRHPTDKERYWVEPERWVSDVKRGLEYREHKNVYTIKYEDLILDFEQAAGALADFLQISDVETLMRWHDNTTVKENRAWSGEVQPLFSDSVAKWKAPKYENRVADFMKNREAVELLRELGYQT